MNKDPTNNVGWLDWQVWISALLYLVLRLCSHYLDLSILKYIAMAPLIYGVIRTFARALKR